LEPASEKHPENVATIVATLTTPPAADLMAAAAGADWLEVRADLVGDLDPASLRKAFPGPLLYTLRSRHEGGGAEMSADRRRRRLVEAAERYDLVDLEASRDLTPDVLRAVPPERRVISWHGPSIDALALRAVFQKMQGTDARLYKLVPTANSPGEELPVLLFLHALERQDVAAFAAGKAGTWTRFVAPRLGAPVVYAALSEKTPGAPGQVSLRRLREDYGLPALPRVEALYGIVGNPVTHSLSPRIHNGAYRALGIPAAYLPFQTESFGELWLEVVESGVPEALGMPLRGLSVTAPYTEAALAVAGAESPLASLIGAANTLVYNQGCWEAESTDPEGVVLPLKDRGLDPAKLRAAVVGAGGAGRSAAAGLARAGAEVVLVNRGSERGERSADLLSLPFLLLSDFDPSAFDLIVQATSVGRSPGEPLPFDVSALRPGTVVMDLVYGDTPTPLLLAAADRGAVTIDGREVLLDQALGQFRMMTGRELPVPLARRLLGLDAPEMGEEGGSA
jgi:3-dehydroquinate dehydratase/shikimate dehydrogenase